ncbi:MAG: late control protein D [Devosiaceae bacterium]|nr:late control protein D [Devosiaceae bacterium]
MRPVCKITIDGQTASNELMGRVISCSVNDKEGVGSDTCQIELNNSPSAQIPSRGAIIRIWLGYDTQLSFMGTFVVDEVSLTLFPHKMSIGGKAADMREKIKENKERHWDKINLGKIVSQIAGDNGLEAKVDSSLANFSYDWFGQQDESDIHVLKRLERQHDALFSVKDNKLIFAKKGTGKTPSGNDLSKVTVTKNNIIEGSGKISLSDRAEYKEVVAYHQNRDDVERKEIKANSSADGTATYRIGEPSASLSEAQAAANSKAKELKRQAIKFSCNIFGNPAARAGAPLVFSGMKVGVDGFEFIIEAAGHKWSKSGYTTSLSGKLKV